MHKSLEAKFMGGGLKIQAIKPIQPLKRVQRTRGKYERMHSTAQPSHSLPLAPSQRLLKDFMPQVARILSSFGSGFGGI